MQFGDFEFDLQRGLLSQLGEAVHLTSGEAALLKQLAMRPGETISREDLGSGTDDGTGRAVDVQITRLRRKVESDPRLPRYLQTVRGEGYVLWAD